MGPFAVGDVVTILFPFADLSALKARPAVIVGIADLNNVIVCQITSNAAASKKALVLGSTDFREGELRLISYIRPDKIFTLDTKLIRQSVGKLSSQKIVEMRQALAAILT